MRMKQCYSPQPLAVKVNGRLSFTKPLKYGTLHLLLRSAGILTPAALALSVPVDRADLWDGLGGYDRTPGCLVQPGAFFGACAAGLRYR